MNEEIKDPGILFFETAGASGEQLTEAVADLTNQIQPKGLYQYSLGIKDILIDYQTYPEREIYVSKPFEVKGIVGEVELESNEEHPSFDTVSYQATDRRTSVEYYLTDKERPDIDDWQAILPKAVATIRCERLFFEGNQAKLRFPARMDTIQVYEDGVLLPETHVVLFSPESLQLPYRKNSGIYTVDYSPDTSIRNPYVFQVLEQSPELTVITETFPNGTAYNKTLTLSHHPFVDYSRILADTNYNPNTSDYKPIRVRLVDANIQGKNNTVKKTIEPYREELVGDAYTYNKTLYKDKSWSELQNYSLSPGFYYGGFDYYHWKNKLTFTEQFNVKQIRENLSETHGNATVEVRYETISSRFRLKIILRRNSRSDISASPRVLDYALNFKTLGGGSV